MTPADSFAVPVSVDKDNVTVASFTKPATGESAIHIVNNASSCKAVVKGLPAGTSRAVVYITNSAQKSEAKMIKVKNQAPRSAGCLPKVS